ncbi:type II/IV secretion system protein [Chitinibacter bivalviorum]|uniref:Type II/IV secretion system protein n=1 Tax=Chitinibacter bivalviorum TaxID=2739434 RepID=A0A7H9BK46_9NEIS|nr:GspE/PulE family protein [Chitinibacter bivalviorum]QLG89055.1 type II/IV secretion system protein [Chitinibacter bivalviorum]
MTATSKSLALTQFHHLVCELYPALSALELVGNLHEYWNKLANEAQVSQYVLQEQLANHLGIEPLKYFDPDPAVATLLLPSKARKHMALPMYRKDGILHVAIANPADTELQLTLNFLADGALKLLLAIPEDLDAAIQFAYSGHQSSGGDANESLLNHAIDSNLQSEEVLVELARELSRQAIRNNASDLHLMPFLGGGSVRIRVDGQLRRVALIPLKVYEALCRYLKVQAGMDPTNERTPQDGRISMRYENRTFDLRLSSLPLREGERIVMRFLDQSRSVNLAQSGFAISEMRAIQRLTEHVSGLVLITGPTGSGKTSTLAGILRELNTFQRCIITVENPVEYVIPGISQVDINDKAGMTFAAALRSTLRQDPDIVLIGEIRDAETAMIALQAALTGHLVLSTLHTNDAWGAIPRLLDLGCKPSVLADALNGVIAQRLYRRLCRECREAVSEPLSAEEAAFHNLTRAKPAYRAVGCPSCHYSGYSGRLPFSEILELTPQLRQQISEGNLHPPEISRTPNSTQSLSSSIARHIISGRTTVSEALHIMGAKLWHDLAKEYGTPAPTSSFFDCNSTHAQTMSVLFISSKPDVTDEFDAELDQVGFMTLSCQTAKEACSLVEQNENIALIVADLDSAFTSSEALLWMQEARRELSWSRLPALILLPVGKEEWGPLLKADGAISPCLARPLQPKQLSEQILRPFESQL